MSGVLASLLRRLPRFGRFGAEPPGDRWVVVDTETSGLDPERDRLLAIGGVAVSAAGIEIDDSFEIVLKGDPSGDAANIVVHGIGHGAQARGVPVGAALAAFRDWAADAPRVGFHADFDRAVLRHAFARAGVSGHDAPWLDLAPLAAALVPEAYRYRYGGRSLDDWLAAFGIECTIRHNAAADAMATAELLLRLRAVAAKQGARGHSALLKVARQQKWLASGGDD
jgi:DNA polymerase-3 subunit epsilon